MFDKYNTVVMFRFYNITLSYIKFAAISGISFGISSCESSLCSHNHQRRTSNYPILLSYVWLAYIDM